MIDKMLSICVLESKRLDHSQTPVLDVSDEGKPAGRSVGCSKIAAITYALGGRFYERVSGIRTGF
jgi:hypothetical protein